MRAGQMKVVQQLTPVVKKAVAGTKKAVEKVVKKVRSNRVPGARQQLVFGQKRVGARFGVKGRPPHLAGRSVSEVADDLIAKKLSPDQIPIEAFYHEGQLVSANTRSLAALSEAGLKPTKIKIIKPSPKLLRRLTETPVIPNAPLPGLRIPVTPSQSNLRVLRIIEVPGG